MGKPVKADRVRETLDLLVDRFERGDVPALIAKGVFPAPNIPMAKWSLSNRTIAMLRNSTDARGYRQWQSVGRQVRKGARSFTILGPRMVKVKDKKTEEESMRLIGFVGIPVFDLTFTEGDAVDYGLPALPKHPLSDVAEKWGITVRAAGGNQGCYGWTTGTEIVLCTDSELTWLHELSHCADARARGKALKGGQHSDQEIVAQLGAAVLAHLVGRQNPNDGYSLDYIDTYARKWFPKASPADALRKACHRVLARACKAIELILSVANEEGTAATDAAA